ncbi:MAG: hypothetical protein ACTSPQ_20490 [Candidatus Helarchaeota archaeon]
MNRIDLEELSLDLEEISSDLEEINSDLEELNLKELFEGVLILVKF